MFKWFKRKKAADNTAVNTPESTIEAAAPVETPAEDKTTIETTEAAVETPVDETADTTLETPDTIAEGEPAETETFEAEAEITDSDDEVSATEALDAMTEDEPAEAEASEAEAEIADPEDEAPETETAGSNDEIPETETADTETEPSQTEAAEVPEVDPEKGRYIDPATKKKWDQIDNAFEERRQRRAEEQQARLDARKRFERRRRIITAISIIGALAALAFVFAWSQGLIINKVADLPTIATEPVTETALETTGEAAASLEESAAAETTVVETTVEETETGRFDQPTQIGLEADSETSEADPADQNTVSALDPVDFFGGYSIYTEDAPRMENEDIESLNAILVDLQDGSVIAQRDADAVISPASMTKILTILVAAEHLEQSDLDDTFTFESDIMDYVYLNDCSVVGFEEGETVTVRDLFYGTILPSGADAALGLAHYVAGNQSNFVKLMNEKLDELGLSDTAHFTNCVGLYNEDHYCTVSDMAMILKAAVEDNYCRQILAEHVYTTSSTDIHPDGIVISNWFLRRIEDHESHGTVLCAKTGFVNEAGCCSASYCVGDNGREYICVTTGATSSWSCIYDHVTIYDQYLSQAE